MPENWEFHKELIKELYIARGYTLNQLRETMSIKHGINASPRTYKMKLDEWNIRKNKRKRKAQIREEHSKTASPRSFSATSDISSSPSTTVNGELHVSNDSSPTSTLCSTRTPLHMYHQPFQLETVPPSASDPIQPYNPMHSAAPHEPSIDPDDLGPIVVNSSLMFFSFRTDSQSLNLLAKFPTMAPRAIEILLRNWKSGGEYMHYALRFLKESAYCHTLLSVNWTRWTHQDETLFDLIDVYIPEDEQVTLTKAILRADLMFQYPLEPLHSAWASRWRLALQQTEWNTVKACLMRLGSHRRLIYCALSVVGESIMRSQSRIWNWDAASGESYLDAKLQNSQSYCGEVTDGMAKTLVPSCGTVLVDIHST